MKLKNPLRSLRPRLPPQTWWGIYSTIMTMLLVFLALSFLFDALKGALP